jgi:hypothetical protein
MQPCWRTSPSSWSRWQDSSAAGQTHCSARAWCHLLCSQQQQQQLTVTKQRQARCTLAVCQQQWQPPQQQHQAEHQVVRHK